MLYTIIRNLISRAVVLPDRAQALRLGETERAKREVLLAVRIETQADERS